MKKTFLVIIARSFMLIVVPIAFLVFVVKTAYNAIMGLWDCVVMGALDEELLEFFK